MKKNVWTVKSLEKFFLKETMEDDDQCKLLASMLLKNNIIKLLLKSDPADYK